VELGLQRISQALDSYVRPGTFPVAVRMLSSAGEIPEKARMPKRDLGMAMAVCQIIGLARRYGWSMGMGEADMLCPLGALTLGFLPAKFKFLDGTFNAPFYEKNQDVRAKIARGLPRLEQGKYTHLVAAPLQRADFEPQVIIVYGNPAQIARLIQAAAYGTGEPVVSSSGGSAACSEEITRTILTGQYQFIVVGGSDRVFAQTQDHEVSFAIPMGRADALIEGLEATHRAGMRYPTPSFLTFKPEFPPSFAELMDHLRQGA
jgi:uncharacterized protein (DUF169 family)